MSQSRCFIGLLGFSFATAVLCYDIGAKHGFDDGYAMAVKLSRVTTGYDNTCFGHQCLKPKESRDDGQGPLPRSYTVDMGKGNLVPKVPLAYAPVPYPRLSQTSRGHDLFLGFPATSEEKQKAADDNGNGVCQKMETPCDSSRHIPCELSWVESATNKPIPSPLSSPGEFNSCPGTCACSDKVEHTCPGREVSPIQDEPSKSTSGIGWKTAPPDASSSVILKSDAPPPSKMSIIGANNKPIVEINLKTGRATLHGNPNEAAKVFWKAVEHERCAGESK